MTTWQVFPDHWGQVLGSIDCRLLFHYFWPTTPLRPRDAAAPANPLFPSVRLAATRLGLESVEPGQPLRAEGAGVRRRPDRARADANVACGLTAALLWNPVTNPTGERCGISDFMRAVFGVMITPDAPNGKGRLAIDNIGVQYGLARCSAGRSLPEQFADLNAEGRRDGRRRQLRGAAGVRRPCALEIPYRRGA